MFFFSLSPFASSTSIGVSLRCSCSTLALFAALMASTSPPSFALATICAGSKCSPNKCLVAASSLSRALSSSPHSELASALDLDDARLSGATTAALPLPSEIGVEKRDCKRELERASLCDVREASGEDDAC